MDRTIKTILLLAVLCSGQAQAAPDWLNTTGRFFRHPVTYKVGFYALTLSYGITDALRDSDNHAQYGPGPHATYLTDNTSFHMIKQFNRLFLFGSGAAIAGAYADGYITFWSAVKRIVYGGCLAYLPWRAVYLKNKHNIWYSNDALYNQHLIPYFYPWSLEDKYWAAKGKQVDTFYTLVTGIGLTGMLFDDPVTHNHQPQRIQPDTRETIIATRYRPLGPAAETFNVLCPQKR